MFFCVGVEKGKLNRFEPEKHRTGDLPEIFVKKRSSQVSWEACSLGTPIPQICVVSVNKYVENWFRCMVNNARK